MTTSPPQLTSESPQEFTQREGSLDVLAERLDKLGDANVCRGNGGKRLCPSRLTPTRLLLEFKGRFLWGAAASRPTLVSFLKLVHFFPSLLFFFILFILLHFYFIIHFLF